LTFFACLFVTIYFLVTSVADRECFSRILIFVHPGSRIQKRRVEKQICCPTFCCCHKYHKIKNYFIFEQVKKKLLANLQRIIELFTP
jgi:hypothetical protein